MTVLIYQENKSKDFNCLTIRPLRPTPPPHLQIIRTQKTCIVLLGFVKVVRITESDSLFLSTFPAVFLN